MVAAANLAVAYLLFFFFNDTATTEIYTLSLHDALPISQARLACGDHGAESGALTSVACRSEEHTSELQSPCNLVCRLLLEKKKKTWGLTAFAYLPTALLMLPGSLRSRDLPAPDRGELRRHKVQSLSLILFIFFFFNDTATTEIYTLSLHDALPICVRGVQHFVHLRVSRREMRE